MATIGRGDAVLQMPNGIKITGVIAWLGWIALHLLYILGGRNRVQTMINLTVRYVGVKRSGAIVGDVMEPPAAARRSASGDVHPPVRFPARAVDASDSYPAQLCQYEG